jgi:hypothetical protein
MRVASLPARFRRPAHSPSFKPILSAITVRRDLAAIATMLGVMSIIGTADALAGAAVSNSSGAPPALDPLTVESRPHDRDEKPYRNLLKAITVFEANRRMAPEAVMRFKVFPWRNASVMQGLTLALAWPHDQARHCVGGRRQLYARARSAGCGRQRLGGQQPDEREPRLASRHSHAGTTRQHATPWAICG